MESMSELAEAAAGTTDPRVALRAVAALHRLAAQLERAHVANARAQGMTWQEIADALGVTRQAVHHKHAARRSRSG
jgi:predicted transcriptional regulator